MSDPKTTPPLLSVRFPNHMAYSVKPPEKHWLDRWHWLRDQDGDFFLADWHYKVGWHWGWSGKAEPENMAGWTYVCVVAKPPEEMQNAEH